MTGGQIWRNGKIPVVYQPPGKQPLLVRLPYREDNYLWLRDDGRHIQWHPQWKAWEIPRSRLNKTVQLALERFESCYLIQSYRPLEKCAPACWNAQGFECHCSCMGANHGTGMALSHVISETFAFEWGQQKLGCRLITHLEEK